MVIRKLFLTIMDGYTYFAVLGDEWRLFMLITYSGEKN